MVMAVADRRKEGARTRLAWLRNEDKGKERQTDSTRGGFEFSSPCSLSYNIV